ncbi:mid1-interacting protein 1-B-like [Limulus polyphemus]|uniref:Mid1-interacting protein 1-B-like n=1 Tax=Limulus polyphemus TaxID=6850 RepID=A0ABM1BEL3_LIMPO|nr:mid1-interacting protein 1-B-like [Limulus polyphemus]
MLHHMYDVKPSTGQHSNNSGRHIRSKRRHAGDDAFTCSQQSILSAMDRFVNSVTNMDSTVLVPSRLRDMETDGGNVHQRPPQFMSKMDLFTFFTALNDIKNELLWGPAIGGTNLSSTVSGTERQHLAATMTRYPSEENPGLSSKSSVSDSDSQGDSDVDGVINDPDSLTSEAQKTHLATAYRYHLQGLQTILHQLSDSADYLSFRYQEEVEASSV